MTPKGAIELRRARSLLAHWRNGRLVFLNFAARKSVSANPITCDILNYFSRWRKPKEAVSHFSSYTPRSVRSALIQLTRQKLLLAKNSAEALEDSRISREWSAWLPEGGFHFATKNAIYVRSRTRTRWLKTILPKTPPPTFFKSIRGAKKIRLPVPIFRNSEFVRTVMARRTHRHFSDQPVSLAEVSKLLFLVWKVTGYLKSPVFGRLPTKTSPSGGARHPGEAYLVALRIRGLKPGLYHYHCGRHELELVSSKVSRTRAWRYCAHQDYVRNSAALFLMTAMFKRTMWKYNHARAYRVVLLDAGHLCQTFCLAAVWLGLAPFCTAALNDTLIEQDLGIDGVRESVLYLAGVGVLPNSTPSKAADHVD